MVYENEMHRAREAYLEDPFCKIREQALRAITSNYAQHIGAVDQYRLHQMYEKTLEASILGDPFIASASKIQMDAILPHLTIRGDKDGELAFA